MWRNVSKALWCKLLSMGIASHKTKKGDGCQKLDYNPNYLKKTIGYSLRCIGGRDNFVRLFSKSVAAVFDGVEYALLVFFQFLEPVAEIFHIFKMAFFSFDKNVDFLLQELHPGHQFVHGRNGLLFGWLNSVFVGIVLMMTFSSAASFRILYKPVVPNRLRIEAADSFPRRTTISWICSGETSFVEDISYILVPTKPPHMVWSTFGEPAAHLATCEKTCADLQKNL